MHLYLWTLHTFLTGGNSDFDQTSVRMESSVQSVTQISFGLPPLQMAFLFHSPQSAGAGSTMGHTDVMAPLWPCISGQGAASVGTVGCRSIFRSHSFPGVAGHHLTQKTGSFINMSSLTQTQCVPKSTS